MLIICSWCNKVNVRRESWQEVEEAMESLELSEIEELSPPSHGMCEICYQSMSEKLENLRNV